MRATPTYVTSKDKAQKISFQNLGGPLASSHDTEDMSLLLTELKRILTAAANFFYPGEP
jgi:hypothetical protein